MTVDIHYGEPPRRLVAAILDLAIVALPVAVAAALMPGQVAADEMAAGLIVLASGLIMFYKIVLEGSARKATVGKLLLDIKVTGLDGAQLSYASCALRSWPLWLPGAMVGVTGTLQPLIVVLCLVAVGLIPFNGRRQGLHDMMARAVVVRGHEFSRPMTDRDDPDHG